MKRFYQTREWISVATTSLEMANRALFKPYDTGELNAYDKVDSRLEELRKQIWALREALVDVHEALVIDVDLEELSAGALVEHYQMGLMRKEQEVEYLFGKKEELPF